MFFVYCNSIFNEILYCTNVHLTHFQNILAIFHLYEQPNMDFKNAQKFDTSHELFFWLHKNRENFVFCNRLKIKF